jgi:hypothetical protein
VTESTLTIILSPRPGPHRSRPPPARRLCRLSCASRSETWCPVSELIFRFAQRCDRGQSAGGRVVGVQGAGAGRLTDPRARAIARELATAVIADYGRYEVNEAWRASWTTSKLASPTCASDDAPARPTTFCLNACSSRSAPSRSFPTSSANEQYVRVALCPI